MRVLVWVLVLLAVASCSEGPTSSDPSGDDVQVPAVPTDLQVTALSSTELRLEWTDNSENEDGFRVYRDDEVAGVVGADETVFEDTGLSPETDYEYAVESFNAEGGSGPSEAVIGTTLGGAQTVVSDSLITLSMEEGAGSPADTSIAVSNGGDMPLTGLAVSVTYDGGQPTGWLTATLSDTTAPATLTLAASADSLAAGEYGATVTVQSPVATNGPVAIDVSLSVLPAGDTASLRDVVINEVNWYGNGSDTTDEWIELRNRTGSAIDISGWTLEAAGSAGDPVVLEPGTVLDPGAYLVIGEHQGPDSPGQRTSLTGVANVQLHSLSLSNGGEQLGLRDINGTLIDGTPTGSWPAGSSESLQSMERRDDITGGGYAAGEFASSWYTWNGDYGVDYTSSETADSGTPGGANSDPDYVAPSIGLSPDSLTFMAEEGGPDPDSQAVAVSNTGGGELTDLVATVDYADGQPVGWLTAGLAATTAPTTLSLQAATGTLAIGNYSSSVAVTGADADNSPQYVTVTYSVVRNHATYPGIYVLNPTVQATCPVPTGFTDYDEITIAEVEITDASLDTLTIRVGLEWETLGPMPVELVASLDPVTQSFSGSVPLSIDESGTGFSITGDGTLSLEGEFTGDDFIGHIDLVLELTFEVIGSSTAEGPCTGGSADVTGELTAG